MLLQLSISQQRRLLHLLVLLAFLCLGVGLSAPMLSLEQFYLLENRFSLLSALLELAREGRWPLALLLGLFSVVLPLGKLLLLLRLARGSALGLRASRLLDWIHRYGRWSMLDVFVVAVLVAAVKLGALVSVELHYGFYLFALAVLLTLSATALGVRLLEREVACAD